MGRYIISGGHRLNGEVSLQGSKNASLPIMAACVLSGGEHILRNVPDIEDVRTMKQILASVGCSVRTEKNICVIDSAGINNNEVAEKLVSRMRSSIILLGAMIAKQKHARFSYPGGCEIGLRPIDMHLDGLSALGARIREEHGYIIVDGTDMSSGSVVLNYPSVGATENLMLASVFTPGVTAVANAAREPEIVDLQNFLNSMGARVYGAGTNTVFIEGVEKLHSCEYRIMSDRIVLGTLMCMTHITSGDIMIKDASVDHIRSPYYKLIESGMKIQSASDGIRCSGGDIKAVGAVITQPYPGFPTDMQPIFTSMLSYSQGVSLVTETVFENRYKYISQLKRMGADIKTEGRIAVITGTQKLSGAKVYSQDLRGGAALVAAALGAEGSSIVEGAEFVERGYEDLPAMLRSLGADISQFN